MTRGAMNNLILAHAQVWGLFVMLGALIYFIYIILTGHAKLDPTTEKLAYTVLGVFLAKFGDMVAYLYNKPRPEGQSVFAPTPQAPAAPPAAPSIEILPASPAQPQEIVT